MNQFQLSVPTKIHFGSGVLKEALKSENKLIFGNVMIVTTGRSLKKLGYIEMLYNAVNSLSNINSVIIYDKITANPKLSEVQEGVSIGILNKVSVIIGFGGGSAIDAAKAIAAGIGSNHQIEDMMSGIITPSFNTLPIIAIPTTAGSGSELSKAAIITDTKHNIKAGIRGDALYPKVAIVDPSLTFEIPLKVTVETGFDVLAHAIESYISLSSNNFSEMLSLYAIKIVADYLPRLANNLHDTVAREHMSYASMLMGVNLGNTGNALPHRMQYPVGAFTNTSHAAGLAALYPAWVLYGYEYSADKFNHIASLLSGNLCNTKNDVLDVLKKFLLNLNIAYSLSTFGLKECDIEKLTNEVTGNIKTDPATIDNDIIYKIYSEAI